MRDRAEATLPTNCSTLTVPTTLALFLFSCNPRLVHPLCPSVPLILSLPLDTYHMYRTSTALDSSPKLPTQFNSLL